MIRQERMRRATSAGVHDSLAQSRARCTSLAGFVRESWHVLHPDTPYEHNWHIDLVCSHLEAISSGVLLELGLENRLRISMRDGPLKSYLVAVAWQAWEWGPIGQPGMQYLTTTYREDYARRDSRKTRDLIKSQWYQDRWPLNLTSEGERFFANDLRGFRQAVPFESLTGGRAD